jgi:hypothetical protein
MDRTWLGDYGETLDALVERCAPLTKAVWVNGSRAVGRHDPDSDLDIVLVALDETHLEHVDTALQEHLHVDRRFPDYFAETPLPLWMAPAGEVGVHIDIAEGLRNRVEISMAGPSCLEQHQAFLQHKIVNARPLLDPCSILTDLQRRCRMVPSSHFDAVAGRYRALLAQKLRWWTLRPRWKSSFECLSDMSVIVGELAQFHYAMNRTFLMPGLKEYRFDLRGFAPALEHEFTELLSLPPFAGPRWRPLVTVIFDKMCRHHDLMLRKGPGS